jgi:exopolyphosphatase/guanosine-5'-triphosphate,3'-diphosphate pyrophosphatase
LRYAAVDIGSNAVRLLLSHAVEEHGEVHYKKNEFVRIPLRLGDDVFQIGRISHQKTRRLLKTLHAFKLLIDVYAPTAFRACATAALREADNGAEVVRMVKRTCGLPVEIISGQAEAELICANHVEEYLDPNENYLYIDVGGGSTELSLFDHGECLFSRSFDVGTIKWLKKRITRETWEEFKACVRRITEDHHPVTAIGSGGNINKMYKLLGKGGKPLPYYRLKAFYDEARACTLEDRMEIWRLNADRADVIVPAAKIFLGAMKAGGIDEVIVPQIGLVDGIVHRLHEKALESMVA